MSDFPEALRSTYSTSLQQLQARGYQCYATFIPKRMDFRKGEAWCVPEQRQVVLENLRARRANFVETIDELVRNT